jgi:anti-anti-sigma regulatory factor
MLRINVQQDTEAVTIQLEGQVAGPSVVKLNRAWIEFAALPASTPFVIDLRNVTEADAWGVRALRDLQTLTGARMITSSPLSKYVAESVARHFAPQLHRGVQKAAVRRSRFHARKGTI